MNILKNKKVVIGGVLVLLAFVAYKAFLVPKDKTAQFLETTSTRTNDGPSREVAELLSSVRGIQLDDQFFKNLAFRSLTDFSVPLAAEPVGRPNPFANLGGAPSSGATPSGN